MKNKLPATLIIVSAIALLTMGGIAFYQHNTPEPIVSRPFLCLTPYSLSYCHAHQYQMYHENAERAR